MQKIELLVDETLENLKYKMFKERAPFLELETTGFSELDKQIKGIAAGSITTIGSCHTALVKGLLLQLSEHFAVTLGMTVVYFSSDQKKSQICQRLILNAALLSLAELNVDDELADSWSQIKKSISQLRQTNLFIEESNFLTIEDVETLCRSITPTPSQSLTVKDSPYKCFQPLLDQGWKFLTPLERSSRCTSSPFQAPESDRQNLNW